MNAPELDVIFDVFIRSSSTCSILVDLNGKIIRFNDAYKELVGYDYEEIKDNITAVFESEAAYQREIDFMHDILKGHRGDIKYESTRVTKSGRIVPVEVTALLFAGSDGKPGFLLKRIDDISQRVQSEAISHNQMFFLNTLLNEVPLSIYFKDKESRFLLNSKKHLSGFGVTDPNAVRGKTDFDFFAPEHARKALEDEQRIMQTGQPLNIVEKIIDKDGNVRWGQTIKQVLKDQNGEVLGTFGIIRDITELKMAQEALEAANATKDKFFSIIAHDMNDHFSGLLGYTEMLDTDFDRFGEEEKRTMVHTIGELSRQLYKLLQNLLEWANLQTGNKAFKPSHFPLNAFILDEITLLKQYAAAKEQTLIFKEGSETMVFGDESMISFVLRNLVSNAIKFTPSQGVIVISTTSLARCAQITVEDNGVGIPSDIVNRLFEVSESIRTYGTNQEAGTGLGLILCKEFIEKNGGTIRLSSEVGKGTVATFTLPQFGLP